MNENFTPTNIRKHKGKSLILFPSSYCIIDLETTGLDPFYDKIIEVSAVKICNGNIIDKFTSLANIGNDKLSSFITQLTGITTEMLVDAPNLNDVLSEFTNFISDNIVIAHNANFDINFIYDNCMALLNKPFTNDFVDTLRLARRLLPELTNHKLVTLANNYNIDYSNAHRALSDCEITYNCYINLKNEALQKYGSTDAFINSCKYHNLKVSEITTSKAEFDTSNPFYNKVCVFTGKLDKMTRANAAQMVVDLGGICNNSVTQKTDYLILGNTDYAKNVKEGKTAKLKKAQDLILNGSELEIITENVFYEMLSHKEV